MKKRMSQWINRFSQPRWRHGKLGAVLMAAFLIFVLKICVEKYRMISFLLSLNHIPVCKTVKPLSLEIVGKIQIKICRIKFLIYLLI